MSYATVYDLLERIHQLQPEDRRLLEELLAREEEVEWHREAADARRVARENGVDQGTIDRAVYAMRHGE